MQIKAHACSQCHNQNNSLILIVSSGKSVTRMSPQLFYVYLVNRFGGQTQENHIINQISMEVNKGFIVITEHKLEEDGAK